MSKHQLWYSAKCRHCQAFLEELTKTPFVPQFQLICIDPSPNRPPLPSWLKVVPSLIVRGEFEPRVGPGPVNNWLFEAKMGGGGGGTSSKKAQNDLAAPVYNSDMNASRGDIPRPSPAGAGNQSAMPSGGLAGGAAAGEPLAYYGSEMAAGKWSDSFSFITDQSVTAEKGINPIERNFQSVLPPGPGSAIGGPSMTGGGGGGAANRGEKRSAKEDALLRDFEAYSASRDRDVAGPIARK